jgi:Protein of unknown function (DUF2934)
MSKSQKTYQEPTSEEIAACAYLIYEREGRPDGKATQHWLEAEAQLIAERRAQAGQSSARAAIQVAPGNDGQASRKPLNPAWSAPTAPTRSRPVAHAH